MTWWIAIAILGAPLTLLIHELSHAACVWLGGGTVTHFRPCPHRAASDGRWLLGGIRHEGTSEPWRSRSHVAPLVESVTLAVLWGGLGLVWAPLWALGVWEMLDVGNWMRGYVGWGSPGMDGARWRSSAASG